MSPSCVIVAIIVSDAHGCVCEKRHAEQERPGAIFTQNIFERRLSGDAVATCSALVIDEGWIDECFDKFEGSLDDTAKASRA